MSFINIIETNANEKKKKTKKKKKKKKKRLVISEQTHMSDYPLKYVQLQKFTFSIPIIYLLEIKKLGYL